MLSRSSKQIIHVPAPSVFHENFDETIAIVPAHLTPCPSPGSNPLASVYLKCTCFFFNYYKSMSAHQSSLSAEASD